MTGTPFHFPGREEEPAAELWLPENENARPAVVLGGDHALGAAAGGVAGLPPSGAPESAFSAAMRWRTIS